MASSYPARRRAFLLAELEAELNKALSAVHEDFFFGDPLDDVEAPPPYGDEDVPGYVDNEAA